VVHVDVAVSLEKIYSGYSVHGPACVPACLLKCPMLNVNICYIQDGHYTKAQRLSMTISVAMKVKL
jgi:hypothetical protein